MSPIPVKNGLAFQTYKKTRKVSRLIPGYSVAGRNFIHPRIPAVATRRDGGGNGDHDGDDDEAVVEDATIGFGFFVVVPVFRFFTSPRVFWNTASGNHYLGVLSCRLNVIIVTYFLNDPFRKINYALAYGFTNIVNLKRVLG